MNLFDGKDYNAEETMNFQAELRFTPSENLDISWRADSGYNDASLVFYSLYRIFSTLYHFLSTRPAIQELLSVTTLMPIILILMACHLMRIASGRELPLH